MAAPPGLAGISGCADGASSVATFGADTGQVTPPDSSGATAAPTGAQPSDTAATEETWTEMPATEAAVTEAADMAGTEATDASPDVLPEASRGQCVVSLDERDRHTTRTYSYDAMGRRTKSIWRLQSQVADAGEETWSYDEAGTLREHFDGWRLAATDSAAATGNLEHEVWNAAGKLTFSESDAGYDGIVDSWSEVAYGPDACSFTSKGVDPWGRYYTGLLECDGNGDPRHFEQDYDDDLVPDLTVDTTWDDQHRVLTEVEVSEASWMKQTCSYQPSPDGTTLGRCTFGFSPDDIARIDAVFEKVFDPSFSASLGPLASQLPPGVVARRDDTDNDGTWDRTATIARDGATYLAHTDWHGVVDTFRFDATFDLLEHVYPPDVDGLSARDVFRYDALGGEIEELRLDSHGQVYQRNTKTYDAFHRVLVEAWNPNVQRDYDSLVLSYEYASCW